MKESIHTIPTNINFKLNNKIILITGATDGIGKALPKNRLKILRLLGRKEKIQLLLKNNLENFLTEELHTEQVLISQSQTLLLAEEPL